MACDNERQFLEEAVAYSKQVSPRAVNSSSGQSVDQTVEPINIAVIGETRIGKSSFINSFFDEDVAEVDDVSECTMEIAKYTHPRNNDIILWDAPGIGTAKFGKENYEKTIGGFEKYDFFLLLTESIFKENTIWLAKQIKKKSKNFYFVRTKIDNTLDNATSGRKMKNLTPAERDEKRKDAEKRTRQELERSLNAEGFDMFVSKVFLVNNNEPNSFDFNDLQTELCTVSYERLKKNQLMKTICVRNEDMLKAKYDAFKKKIFVLAGLSASYALTPVPGLSLMIDLALVMESCGEYYESLGLNRRSVAAFEKELGYREGTLAREFEKILEQDYPLIHDMWQVDNGKTSIDFIVWLLLKEATTILPRIALLGVSEVAESVLGLIPLVGTVAGSALSFLTTCVVLRRLLWQFREAAVRLRSLPSNLATHVAIIGKCRVGKSSLVESLKRRSSESDAKAEPKRTSRLEKHTSAHNSKIIYWDTPGLDSSNSDVSLSIPTGRYDAFVLLTGNSISREDLWLLEKIKDQKKPIFLVGSKQTIDYDHLLRECKSEENAKRHWRNQLKNSVEISLQISTGQADRLLKIFVVDTLNINNLETKSLYEAITSSSSDKDFQLVVIGRSFTGKTSLIRTLTTHSYESQRSSEEKNSNNCLVSLYDAPELDDIGEFNIFLITTSCSKNSENLSQYESHIVRQVLNMQHARFWLVGGPAQLKHGVLLEDDFEELRDKLQDIRDQALRQKLRREKTDSGAEQRLQKRDQYPVFVLDSTNPKILDFDKLAGNIQQKAKSPLRVAIIGDRGTGKTTLFRALWMNREDGPTTCRIPYGLSLPPTPQRGVIKEIIGKIKCEDHRIKLWDTPGCDFVDFKGYDFFIILVSNGLAGEEIYQVERILWHGKNFVIVKSKAATAIVGQDEASRKDSEKNLRNALLDNRNNVLQSLGFTDNDKYPVYLVDIQNVALFDFRKLQEIIHESAEHETWLRRR